MISFTYDPLYIETYEKFGLISVTVNGEKISLKSQDGQTINDKLISESEFFNLKDDIERIKDAR